MSFTQKLRFLVAFLIVSGYCKIGFNQVYSDPVHRLYTQSLDTLNTSSGVYHYQVGLPDSLTNGLEIGVQPLLAYGLNRVSYKPLSPTYHVGALVDATLKFNRFCVKGALVADYLKPFANYTSTINSLQVIPNESAFYQKYTGGRFSYLQPQFQAQYSAKKFFQLNVGYGKNFIGDGYRSVILSDNSSPTWFAKVQTKFWHFNYTNIWLSPSSVYIDPATNLRNTPARKFIAAHYLTYAVNRKLSISFYEAVVWKGKDTLNNRGFDVNYLNPVVFYRPIEYSTGSSDNSLIALSANWKIFRSASIYGQFLLDEFLASAIKEDFLKQIGRPTSNQWGWWANKQAMQIGAKVTPLKRLKGLMLLAEYNLVRPFTFTHTSVVQSYSNSGQPLALPQGANCSEIVAIASYSKNQWRVFLKSNLLRQGLDSINVNFGQNIFRSSTTRKLDYQNTQYQGILLKQIHLAARLDYALKSTPLINCFVESYYRKRNIAGIDSQQQLGVIIGVCWKGWMPQLDY